MLAVEVLAVEVLAVEVLAVEALKRRFTYCTFASLFQTHAAEF